MEVPAVQGRVVVGQLAALPNGELGVLPECGWVERDLEGRGLKGQLQGNWNIPTSSKNFWAFSHAL